MQNDRGKGGGAGEAAKKKRKRKGSEGEVKTPEAVPDLAKQSASPKSDPKSDVSSAESKQTVQNTSTVEPADSSAAQASPASTAIQGRSDNANLASAKKSKTKRKKQRNETNVKDKDNGAKGAKEADSKGSGGSTVSSQPALKQRQAQPAAFEELEPQIDEGPLDFSNADQTEGSTSQTNASNARQQRNDKKGGGAGSAKQQQQNVNSQSKKKKGAKREKGWLVQVSAQAAHWAAAVKDSISSLPSTLPPDAIFLPRGEQFAVSVIKAPGERDVTELPAVLKETAGREWQQHLCARPRQDESRGAPTCLILTSSAVRACELYKTLGDFKRNLVIGKLFARHIKIQEQTALLQQNVVRICVGTPHRVMQLCDNKSLSVERVDLVVLDMWRNAKDSSLLERGGEVQRDLLNLFYQHLGQRVREGHAHILLF